MIEKPWWKGCCIRGLGFSTKKQLAKHIREIVDSVENGIALSDYDHDFMMDILQHHPEFETKAQGSYKIVVDSPVEFPKQRCFWLVKLDESRIDISWLVALDAKPRGAVADLSSALRHAVRDQILAARDAQLGGTCGVCGKTVLAGDVDHSGVSFAEIRDMWLLTQVAVPLVDIGVTSDLADAAQKADWQDFHSLWADLRFLHTECHKKVTKKGQSKV